MLYRVMRPREIDEEHRAATPLELFYDLCFVVAVSQAGARLHHAFGEGHLAHGVLSYLTVFFAIWWAWVNFTWFASAYDTDDVPYRIAVLVQITGSLILAAGIPRAFDDQDFSIAILGYVVMRVALVAQWLRAAHADRERRATALRYAAGVTFVQVLWVAFLFIPHGVRGPVFIVFCLLDMLVPAFAERAGNTPWHPGHIAERYGLFTLIVLGESLGAATIGVQEALDEHHTAALIPVVIGGILTGFGLWWLYFAKPAEEFLASASTAFWWGYGHYLIFGGAAAFGAGLEVATDQAVGKGHLGAAAAHAAVTVPVAIFLVVLWLLHLRPRRSGLAGLLLPVAAALILAATLTGAAVLLTGLIIAVVVGVSTALTTRRDLTTQSW